MKEVTRPHGFGLALLLAAIFWLLMFSAILAFEYTVDVWSWLLCTIPFWCAVVLAAYVFYRIRRYQNYCEWLEEQHMLAAQEREEMRERFEAVARDFGQLYDLDSDF